MDSHSSNINVLNTFGIYLKSVLIWCSDSGPCAHPATTCTYGETWPDPAPASFGSAGHVQHDAKNCWSWHQRSCPTQVSCPLGSCRWSQEYCQWSQESCLVSGLGRFVGWHRLVFWDMGSNSGRLSGLVGRRKSPLCTNNFLLLIMTLFFIIISNRTKKVWCNHVEHVAHFFITTLTTQLLEIPEGWHHSFHLLVKGSVSYFRSRWAQPKCSEPRYYKHIRWGNDLIVM